jgi:hypothetical protein
VKRKKFYSSEQVITRQISSSCKKNVKYKKNAHRPLKALANVGERLKTVGEQK